MSNNENTIPESERFHFFVFGGVVTYIVNDQEYERKVNAYITSGFQGVNELQLHYAQQQSANLIKKSAPEGLDIKIVNVFINNVDYLGHMTAEEFRPPIEKLTNSENSNETPEISSDSESTSDSSSTD